MVRICAPLAVSPHRYTLEFFYQAVGHAVFGAEEIVNRYPVILGGDSKGELWHGRDVPLADLCFDDTILPLFREPFIGILLFFVKHSREIHFYNLMDNQSGVL